MTDPFALPTSAQIKDRFEARKGNDPFAFEIGEYLPYMNYEDAKGFLKEGATKESWDTDRASYVHTRYALLRRMLEYMEFAWEKANNCRGISANRSILHYIAWTWLAGDAEFSGEIDRMMDEEYRFYGKDILVRICEFYGWDCKKWDDGRRVNSESEL